MRLNITLNLRGLTEPTAGPVRPLTRGDFAKMSPLVNFWRLRRRNLANNPIIGNAFSAEIAAGGRPASAHDFSIQQ